MSDPVAIVPAPASECRLTVVIPARNEAAIIGPTLAALAAQRQFDGTALAPELFDIIVFANNCSDETAAVTRECAARTAACRIHVIEADLAAAHAHIGTARKYVMDIAAARFLAAHRPGGIIASIDADTIPDPDWLASILREARTCEAIAGFVTIGTPEQERLLAPVRLLYARELAYRRALAEIEALIDPVPHDPAPRHGSFVGANFAVKTACYIAAGGLPPLARLEDVAFSLALRRIDARIRYSLLVRATTSARIDARVEGGFGTFIAGLFESARRAESFRVEHPLRSLDDLRSRAALRRIWLGREGPADAAAVTELLNLAQDRWRPALAPDAPFGTAYERILAAAEPLRRSQPEATVEYAIRVLRDAAAERRRYSGTVALDDAAAESGDVS